MIKQWNNKDIIFVATKYPAFHLSFSNTLFLFFARQADPLNSLSGFFHLFYDKRIISMTF